MNMTRQRWIYVGLLGCGLVALAADRLLFSPAGASAAATADAGLLPADSAEPATMSSPPNAQRMTLAERLRSLPADLAVRDGFHADETWIQPPKPEETRTKETGGFSIAEWEAKNPLRSIYAVRQSGGQDAAAEADPLEGGRPRVYQARFGEHDVSEGQFIDGCRVIVIEATTAWVERDGRCYQVDFLHPRKADNRKQPNIIIKSSAEQPAPETPAAPR
jgi:hypothetical protein